MKRIASLLFLSLSLTFILNGQRTYEQSLLECRDLGMLESYKCMEGSDIPLFKGKTVRGSELNNDSIKDKIVVFNFWFMACPPRIAELEGLNKVVDHYKNRNDIVFLSFTKDETVELEKYFFPNHSMKFEIIPDAEQIIFDSFKIRWGFPTTMVIDKTGRIRLLTSGGNSDPEIASSTISQALFDSVEACIKK